MAHYRSWRPDTGPPAVRRCMLSGTGLLVFHNMLVSISCHRNHSCGSNKFRSSSPAHYTCAQSWHPIHCAHYSPFTSLEYGSTQTRQNHSSALLSLAYDFLLLRLEGFVFPFLFLLLSLFLPSLYFQGQPIAFLTGVSVKILQNRFFTCTPYTFARDCFSHRTHTFRIKF